jgi:hypothetical protein
MITKRFLQVNSIKTMTVKNYSIQENHSWFSFKMSDRIQNVVKSLMDINIKTELNNYPN